MSIAIDRVLKPSLLALYFFCACVSARHPEYRLVTNLPNRDSVLRIKAGINRQVSSDSFAAHQYLPAGNNNDTIRYRLLEPAMAVTGERYPLVLILPNSGGIGYDNLTQMNAMVKMWAQPAIRTRYPAYVVAPQFSRRSSNYIMDNGKMVLVSQYDTCLTEALQLIDSLKRTEAIDTGRIYVMGFSMGASSVVNVLGIRPGMFAAAIAVSGIPDFNHLNTLRHTPLWIIHGNADPENPFATDSLLYQQLKSKPVKELRFWEIDQLAHDTYYELYTTDLPEQWLFSHRNGRKW